MAEGVRGRGGRALGRIDVGVGYTRGARSRGWCGWWVKEGASGTGVGGNCSSGMDGSETMTRRYLGRGSVYYSGGFRCRWGVRVFCRNSCFQAVCDTPIAHIYSGLCVLIKDIYIGRRLPLQLQCSYQGQQGDVSHHVYSLICYIHI